MRPTIAVLTAVFLLQWSPTWADPLQDDSLTIEDRGGQSGEGSRLAPEPSAREPVTYRDAGDAWRAR